MTDSTNETIGDSAPEPSKPDWLQQFERFGVEELDKLRAIIEAELTPIGDEVLIWVAKELIVLAQKHDSDAINKFLTLISEANKK